VYLFNYRFSISFWVIFCVAFLLLFLLFLLIVFYVLLIPPYRWQIETVFKALKTSGFNIEDMHLTDIDRINKLFAMVLVAFVWTYRVGIFLDYIRPSKIKKHGRRAQNLFKCRLTHLANVLFFNDIDKFSQCCKFLTCT